MSVLVRIPTPLRALAQGRCEVEVEGSSVREALDGLGRAHGGLAARVRDERGEVRRFVNLFVNDEDVRFLSGLDSPLRDGDTLSIVPALAGG